MIQAHVLLTIGTEVYTHPQDLPALPQIGYLISILLPTREYRYFGRVTEIVFFMNNSAGSSTTDRIEIRCELVSKEKEEIEAL